MGGHGACARGASVGLALVCLAGTVGANADMAAAVIKNLKRDPSEATDKVII